jgi:photosystem II stability/assembly factor-like uncharacterized protein
MRLRPFLNAIVLIFAVNLLQAQDVNPSYFSGMRWRSIGPARSGYVSAPAGVPGDPTTYYVGLPEGGVWKTSNGGTTWKPVFDDLHIASIGAVAVAPSDPKVVYVGTGNQSGWSFTTGKGVYKSTDAGKSWTAVGLEASRYIGAIVVDPRNANTLIVAVQGPAPERGMYRSADGGRTWTKTLNGTETNGAADLFIDYGDPQIAYALLAGGTTAATGVYKSADGGVNWQPVSGRGLPNGARITAFAEASGTHGRRLYAVAGTGGRGGGARGLYRSDDAGDNWVLGTTQLASAGGKIYADPQRSDTVYLMGTAIYRSTDAGRHVAAFWGAPSGADPRFLWIDPANSKRMLAGVDQGAAITVDDGESWTPYYGLVNGQFYRVSTDYDFPYHVCGPQQDSGTACVASRTDFGEIRPYDWYPGGGFENGFLIGDPKDKRYMYTQGWYHVLRRFDRTTGQVVVLYQPAPEDRFSGAPPLAFSAQDPNTLYMAAQYVLASSDRGVTWRRISSDLAAPNGQPAPPSAAEGSTRAAAAAGGSITTLASSPAAPGVVWVGTSTEFIHVTRDGGKTWTNVTPKNLPPGSINIIDASHKNASTAYAALLSRDGHPHLYRTTDFGQNWQEISSGLADDGTARVIREDAAEPTLIYAGTVTSAYVSFDRGDHWQSLQLNLPNTVISDMTIHDADLVISTYGRGFWILDDVSPLRQVRSAMAANSPAFLFKSEPASRARWDNTQDTPVPPEMKVGDNPPEGAIIDYYLSAPASGTITLSISDNAGHIIREFSSAAPPPDTTLPNVPEYWIMPPLVLPTTAGMHRISWDLRYPDPPTLNYGYNGNLLDYREYTLNWHALPGLTYRSTVVGPMVVPGTYTAKLTVNGRSTTTPIAVAADPRVPVSATALNAQFQLQQRMVAGLKTTFDAFNYIQQARAGNPTLDAELAPIAASLGTAHRDLGRRLNDMLVGDVLPTASVIAGVDGPCRVIDAAIGNLRQSLARSNTNTSSAWTPPAPPACGR